VIKIDAGGKKMRLKSKGILLVFVCIAGLAGVGAGTSEAAAVKFISIATGGSGGTYYIIGGGMGKIIEKYVSGVKVSVESTAASTENCRLVASKNVKFAIVMPDSAYFAYNGGREFGDKKYPSIRGVMAGHTSTMHFVVRSKSGIKSLADLKGKKVALAAPGSPSAFIAEAALEAYGLTKKDYKPTLLTYAEQADALRDDTIDMACIFAGVPASAALDVSTTHDVTFLGVGKEEMKKVTQKHPYWTAGLIKAGTYKGQTADVPTFNSPAMLITSDDVEADVVYAVAKAIMDHTPELKAIHPQGAEWDLADAAEGVAIPFHPGAAKYLTEKGIIKK
jgi:TRAP transporter TAXI family solute receptor